LGDEADVVGDRVGARAVSVGSKVNPNGTGVDTFIRQVNSHHVGSLGLIECGKERKEQQCQIDKSFLHRESVTLHFKLVGDKPCKKTRRLSNPKVKNSTLASQNFGVNSNFGGLNGLIGCKEFD
jgi:hypothetical protein